MKKLIFLFIALFSLVFGEDFLEPKDAFKPSVDINGENVVFKFELGKNIYIYADKLKFKDSQNEIKNVSLPEPVAHDEFIVYDRNFTVELPKKLITTGSLIVDFQGCSADGLCYQPMSETFDVGAVAKQSVDLAKSDSKTQKNETDLIADTISSGSLWVVLITFFGFGLLLSLTPCVFPMIPILSSIIIKQSSNQTLSPLQGFMLSLVYVLSMAIAYTIAGVIAGVFGANLQAALQHPAVLVSFAAIFVALAFSMFGYYEIGLPASIQSKISKISDEQKGGLVGTAIMGFLSALIVGPCVAPPLAGALVYIGQTGDAFLGGAALFVMSLGMGMPLLAIGVGAGKFMPKAGMWMMTITRVFGVIMLGVAIWMLERILPSVVSLILWSVLFVASSVYIGTFEPFKEHKSGIAKFTKVIGIFLLFFGMVFFVSALGGGKSVMNPMEPFIAKASEGGVNEINFKKIANVAELDEAISKSSKPVILDFYADWCTSCKEYEEITFKDPAVIAKMSEFELLRVDVTKNSVQDKELLEKFGLFGPPAIIFWDTNKQLLSNASLVGYKNPEDFIKHIDGLEGTK